LLPFSMLEMALCLTVGLFTILTKDIWVGRGGLG